MSIDAKVEYFDEEIPSFYQDLGLDYRSNRRRGQFFWTHVHYKSEDLQFWRPKCFDETKTYASEFTITSSVDDAFKRSVPLYAPPLKINEEFVVVRAKRRPVILIAPVPDKVDAKTIRRGGKVNLNLGICAPLYSVSDTDGYAKYDETFINRIRRLEFPHLFFVLENRAKRLRHSICRLDCVETCYLNQMEAIDVCLSQEALDVFLGQVRFHMTGLYDGEYQQYREYLLQTETGKP